MNRNQKIVHVVLTGGVGSRLWPLSRKSQPKQYLELFEGKSLFEMTLDRNKDLVDEVIVVGNKDNCHLSKNVLDKTNTSSLEIIEATPRNTAAAIAFAALATGPEDILIVTPSDHVIEGEAAYKVAIEKGIAIAKEGNIVTFGIQPTKPETGYGYIEHAGQEVLSFREKPNTETAQDFIAKGNFLWNSGMFCFQARVFLEELKAFQPNVHKASKIAWDHSKAGSLDENLSLEIPSISVDYAVMERSSKMKVVPTSFEWSDLGSFESVYAYLKSKNHPVDTNGNMCIGSEIYTAFVGLKNTIFVHTKTANLILQKEASQDVKQVYSQLEGEGSALLN